MRGPLILAGAAAGAVWTGPALAPIIPSVARLIGVERHVDVADAAAITFDDGPHPQGTPRVLDLLEASGAKATFFLVGEQVEHNVSLAREIADRGHAIAIHGFRHQSQMRLTPRAFRQDLDRAIATISAATETEPTVYRPPYGIFSPTGLAEVRRRGLRPILWSRWGHDWRRRISPERIAREVTEDLGPGDVLLLHDADHYNATDSWRRTVAALPAILDRLESGGLHTGLL